MQFGGSNMIEIQDLTYKYEKTNQNELFHKLSLTLKKGSFTTIVGPIGSGKTTLIKILLGQIKVDAKITIDNIPVTEKNIEQIQQKIGLVSQFPNEFYELPNTQTIAGQLEIEYLLKSDTKHLSSGEKQLLSFLEVLENKPQIIILDEAFTLIDEQKKKQIFNILKQLNKQGITIINFTNDLEESLYGNDIILLQNGTIILNGPKEQILKEEKTLKKAGLELPFLADLSIRLMYYGVLDHIILDMDEMVNTIWK